MDWIDGNDITIIRVDQVQRWGTNVPLPWTPRHDSSSLLETIQIVPEGSSCRGAAATPLDQFGSVVSNCCQGRFRTTLAKLGQYGSYPLQAIVCLAQSRDHAQVPNLRSIIEAIAILRVALGMNQACLLPEAQGRRWHPN